jgi:hypothetical protein
MGILITAPTTGSLKITNTAASPQTNYLCNLQTVNVSGNYNYPNRVSIANSNQQVIFDANVSSITTIAASTPTDGFNLQQVITEIANLIMK